MRLDSAWLFSLSFFRLVYAACNVTGKNPPTIQNLLNLQTPTPFTFTLTAIATGCDTDPLTLSLTETLFVNATEFVGNVVTVTLNQTAAVVYASCTFPDLTVTSLIPGESMTLVIQPMTKDIANSSLMDWNRPVSCKPLFPMPILTSVIPYPQMPFREHQD